MKRSVANPNFLELELTERTFGNQDEMQKMIVELRKLGIKIAIDDFGTGYNSFSYLKELPIDTLKVDCVFIQDIDGKEENRAIVEAILSIAKTVGLNVVAEGIERKEQLSILMEMGCQQGQGFYFSKPTSAKVCENLIESSRE